MGEAGGSRWVMEGGGFPLWGAQRAVLTLCPLCHRFSSSLDLASLPPCSSSFRDRHMSATDSATEGQEMTRPEGVCSALCRNRFGEMLANPSANAAEHRVTISSLTYSFCFKGSSVAWSSTHP